MSSNLTSVDGASWFADSDRLTLVSSVYAPGNVICWLLTVLACFVIWTMNLKGRKADSIDTNLIAALSCMTVAGAHHATQLHARPAHQPFGHFVEEPILQKKIAAIEASARVLEMAMACCVLLFVIAMKFGKLKRAFVVSVIGMFCLAAEVYLFFKIRHTLTTSSANRHLKIGFAVHFVAMFGIGCVVAVVIAYAVFTSLPRSRSQSHMHRRVDGVGRDTSRRQLSANMEYPVLLSIFFVPLCVLTVLFLTGYDFTKNIDEEMWDQAAMWQAVHILGDHLAHHVMPHTNTSIYDLDQAAAFLAGTMIFGFSLYSAADSHYQLWCRGTRIEHATCD